MYYQIYNAANGQTHLTFTDLESALVALDRANNPHYYDMFQQVYKIRVINESEHPLFGEPGFEAAKEMDEEADNYDPEGEWT